MSAVGPRGLLVINAGSSSIKFGVYALGGGGPAEVAQGLIENIGGTDARAVARQADGRVIAAYRPVLRDDGAYTHADALADLLRWLGERPEFPRIVAVGHRVVHGGTIFSAPVRVDAAILAQLERFCPLAPLHQPHNLAGIRAVAAADPALPQVACFDTAFHRSQPELARLFALPRDLREEGVQRYGFHGLSYEYVAARLPALLGECGRGKVVIAHLGNGASMCAIDGGRSVASTMGFTAVEGLPMGTRCGSLDPGVLLYLMEQHGFDVKALTDLLYKRCGLLGLSGLSNDMRTLLASDLPEAKLAVDYFVYRIVRELGSLAAALGGLDALVFTGGIGEHAAPVRESVCRLAAWYGIVFDAQANGAHDTLISAPGSRVVVAVVSTDEEGVIAAHTQRLVAG